MSVKPYEGPLSARKEDLGELNDLLNKTFRSERAGNMLAEYPRHVGECNLDNVRLIRQNGRIVSHVATSVRPVLLNGIPTVEAGIGAVATCESARGQGLASKLMTDAVERSVAQGADLMLISGDESIYLKMHATVCGRFPEVTVTQKDGTTGLDCTLTAASESNVSEIVNLRQAMPTRYMLPREDIAALLQCGFAMDKPVDWWIARISGFPVGWAVTHVHNGQIELIDWAGSEEILPEIAGLLLQHYKASTLHYIAPQFSFLPVKWRYRVRGVVPFGGTALVIDAARFLQRAEPYLIERIGEETWEELEIAAEAQKVEITWKSERAVFENGGELARLFFGHPHEDILLQKAANGSELIALLRKLFPVPLVWYGIGYV